jgi:O-antigen/teichoic acid export membrane protein
MKTSLMTFMAQGAIVIFAKNVVGAGLGALTQLVLARSLGVDSFGLYSYTLAWVNVIVMIATLGFPTASLRFIPTYIARKELGNVRTFIRYAEIRSIAASLALMICGATIVLLASNLFNSDLALTLLVGLTMVPALALLELRSQFLRALGQIFAAFAPSLLLRQILIICGFLLVLRWLPATAPLAILITLFSAVLCVGLVSILLKRARPNTGVGCASSDQRRTWRRSAFLLLLMDAQYVLLTSTDVLMLGALIDTPTAGIYAIAIRIALLAGFPLRAINAVFAPVISTLYEKKDSVELQLSATRTSRWNVASTLCIVLPLFFFSKDILSFFGPDFVGGANVLRVLLLGELVKGMFGSAVMLATMSGNEREAMLVQGITAIANIALNAALIIPFGMEGAALATMLSTVGNRVAFWILIKRKLSIRVDFLGAGKNS